MVVVILYCFVSSQQFRVMTNNKFEFFKVLCYYKLIDRDSLKYKAATFLINNMQYHYSKGKILEKNEAIEHWRKETALSIKNVAFGENSSPEIIELTDQRNKSRHCKAKKQVRVEYEPGKFKFEYMSVLGLENPCEKAVGYTCKAFACYSNLYINK